MKGDVMGIVVRDIADRLDQDPLLLLERFHGHLGPYVVLGYRMGRFARQALSASPFELKAEVLTGNTRPLSCMADGIQVGSGCTLGKGNIAIRPDKKAEVLFTTRDGRSLRLRARPSLIRRISSEVNENNIIDFAERLASQPDENLFEVVDA